MISQRAQELTGSPSAIVVGHLNCLADPYSLENPEGFLNFGIAENHLMSDMLLEFLNRPIKIEKEHIQYCDSRGISSLKTESVKFFHDYLGIKDLDPEKLIINNGVSSLCESLSFSLFDEGDQILIPAPYYTGFEHDFTKRFKCEFIPVQLDPKNNFDHDISPFKEALKAYRKVKAVLITHPHNPTAESISEEFQNDVINFCLENDLHLISDEIYALSRHNGEKHDSLFQKARDRGVKTHFLYGVAKDICLAGYKVGFFYTDNEELTQAMGASSYFYPVGSATQLYIENIFKDRKFLDEYLKINQSRLKHCREKIIKALPMFKFISSETAMFMVLDLSSYCKSLEDEKTLFEDIMDKYKINMTPGLLQGLNKPGYFRVCYAREESHIDAFIERMQKAAKEILK